MGEQGQLIFETVVVFDANNIGVANSGPPRGFCCFLSSLAAGALTLFDGPPANVLVVTVDVVAASDLYNFMKKYGGAGTSEALIASMVFPSLSSRRRSCLVERGVKVQEIMNELSSVRVLWFVEPSNRIRMESE